MASIHAMYVAMHFLQYFSTGDPGVFFAHISMTAWATDFKFAGAAVQRLWLVMVALSQSRLSVRFVVEDHNYKTHNSYT